jgi:protein TonB
MPDKSLAVPVATDANAQVLPPAPAYLPSGKLDPGPRPLQDIEPVYPDEGNLRQGSVVLRLLISERGEVDNVAVVRAYPKGAFENSAIAAFAAARFAPGMMFGVAVKSQLTIEVEFMPINRGARVSGRGY